MYVYVRMYVIDINIGIAIGADTSGTYVLKSI